MNRLALIFLIAMLALGGAAIAWADGPPQLPSDVTCHTQGDTTTCFYPAHDK